MEFPLLTPRLALRPFVMDDLDAIHAVYGDPEVMRYVDDSVAKTREQTAQMLAEYIDHEREHGFGFWAVIHRPTGALIGDAGLSTFRGEIELGYTLARAWWGQGYASEAARRAMGAAAELDIAELIALVRAENGASARIVEKLGFDHDGTIEAFGWPWELYRGEVPRA